MSVGERQAKSVARMFARWEAQDREVIATYLASPEAQKALAEALVPAMTMTTLAKTDRPDLWVAAAKAILAAWREKLR